MSNENTDQIQSAQRDFEKHFGASEYVKAYRDFLAGEHVIVVENHNRRAFYSDSIELIKVINLDGE